MDDSQGRRLEPQPVPLIVRKERRRKSASSAASSSSSASASGDWKCSSQGRRKLRGEEEGALRWMRFNEHLDEERFFEINPKYLMRKDKEDAEDEMRRGSRARSSSGRRGGGLSLHRFSSPPEADIEWKCQETESEWRDVTCSFYPEQGAEREKGVEEENEKGKQKERPTFGEKGRHLYPFWSRGLDDGDDCHKKERPSFPRSLVQRESALVPHVFQSSFFSNVSPTLYFGAEGEVVEPLPEELQPYLKWRLSTITPALIREAVIRSGFKVIKEKSKSKRWMGTWCKHMKCNEYSNTLEFHKINHFPGSFHLGRKDKLWINMRNMANKHGDIVSSFHPMTYLLPQDLKQLRDTWIESYSEDWKMIIKPPASARGNGIQVIHKWSQIPKSAKIRRRHYNRPVLIVQEYISNPCLLFNGAKFDLRVYVLVTSINPLIIYVYEDGLVRFASVPYSSDIESLSDLFMHLTNYSINKKNLDYKCNNDTNAQKGHKWTLKTLWRYLSESVRGVDVEHLWTQIVDMIIKTVISCESPINQLVNRHLKSRYSSFELLGFDIMLDENFKPWLLEVNISPSLRSESSLDTNIKGQLIKDMLNLVGYRLPFFVGEETCLKGRPSVEGLYQDRRFHSFKLTKPEKEKQRLFDRNVRLCFPYEDLLENLTPDDVRHLVASEDELSRCGHFVRVFPSQISDKYLKYFEGPRYYNVLLDTWEKRYRFNRSQGIALLESLCKVNYHVGGRSDETVIEDIRHFKETNR